MSRFTGPAHFNRPHDDSRQPTAVSISSSSLVSPRHSRLPNRASRRTQRALESSLGRAHIPTCKVHRSWRCELEAYLNVYPLKRLNQSDSGCTRKPPTTTERNTQGLKETSWYSCRTIEHRRQYKWSLQLHRIDSCIEVVGLGTHPVHTSTTTHEFRVAGHSRSVQSAKASGKARG